MKKIYQLLFRLELQERKEIQLENVKLPSMINNNKKYRFAHL